MKHGRNLWDGDTTRGTHVLAACALPAMSSHAWFKMPLLILGRNLSNIRASLKLSYTRQWSLKFLSASLQRSVALERSHLCFSFPKQLELRAVLCSFDYLKNAHNNALSNRNFELEIQSKVYYRRTDLKIAIGSDWNSAGPTLVSELDLVHEHVTQYTHANAILRQANGNYWRRNNSETLKGYECLMKCGYSIGLDYCLYSAMKLSTFETH